jgi:hemerythrin-like metal-binding protein
MALFTWDDSYSVGIKDIDSQHKKLVDTLNQLHQGMLNRRSREETGALLKQLATYTVDHFATEERYFVRAQYPKTNEHKALHVELTDQVKAYIARFEKGEISLDIHLLDFLRKWLMNHILKEDMEYRQCLSKAGIR